MWERLPNEIVQVRLVAWSRHLPPARGSVPGALVSILAMPALERWATPYITMPVVPIITPAAAHGYKQALTGWLAHGRAMQEHGHAHGHAIVWGRWERSLCPPTLYHMRSQLAGQYMAAPEWASARSTCRHWRDHITCGIELLEIDLERLPHR